MAKNEFSIKGWRWIPYIIGWFFGFLSPIFWLIMYVIWLQKFDSEPDFIRNNPNFHKRVVIWGYFYVVLIVTVVILGFFL